MNAQGFSFEFGDVKCRRDGRNLAWNGPRMPDVLRRSGGIQSVCA
jgi:hypothetical protein